MTRQRTPHKQINCKDGDNNKTFSTRNIDKRQQKSSNACISINHTMAFSSCVDNEK